MSVSTRVARPTIEPTPHEPLPESRHELIARLPTPLTSLVGRDTEVGTVRALLDSGDVRLLTLTGPGGVGKTRLAIEVATQVREEYAHGVCFVGLAAIRDVALVPVTVARAFGVRESGNRPAAEILEALLRERHLLLVLDNLEQVVAAAPWLAGLLSACPRLTALVTSRIPLRVGGEQRYVVPPLPVPALGTSAPEATAPDAAAVSLFAQRAHAVEPGFALTADNADTVAAICRQLDGLPLAIELAAARSSLLDPAALLSRMEHRLTLLTGGAQDAPHRLQTMRDAIAWSYDLLTAEEQGLFRRLAVFSGGFTLDAAAAVAAAGEHAAIVLDLLTSLVDCSLVRRLPAANGELRFGMLETIREFGLEQLAATGEEDTARDAHAAYFCRLAAEAEPRLRRHEQVAWLDRLETDHDNIRAVFAWLRERGAIEQAGSLACSLWVFWWIRGHYAEACRQLEPLLARPEAAAQTLGRAKALEVYAKAIDVLGEPDRAMLLHEEALSIFREFGDREGIALVLRSRSRPLAEKGQLDRALADVQQSVALCRELGDTWGLAAALVFLANAHAQLGEWERAAAERDECLRIGRELGDRWVLALTLQNMATIAMDGTPSAAADLPRAAALCAESTRLDRELGSKQGLPWNLFGLGCIRQRQGNLAQAAADFEEGLLMARQTGDAGIETFLVFELGVVARLQGDPCRAVRLLRESLDMALARKLAYQSYDSVEQLAYLASGSGQAERAARLLGAADRLLMESNEERLEYQRTEHECQCATLHQGLGAPTFAAAWEAGRVLPIDDVLAEVAALEAAILAEPDPRADHAAPAAPFGLTRREREVLRLVAAGHSDRQIAATLSISLRTASNHVSHILAKLDVETRTAAVGRAIREGLA